MDEIVGGQEVDAVVVPRLFLAETFGHRVVHVGGNHQVAATVVLTADVGIARTAFNTGMLHGTEHAVAVQQVMIMQTVATEGIGRPLALIAHVTEQIAVIAHLQVAGSLTQSGLRGPAGYRHSDNRQ